jgi:Fungal N-terminal domain of STAND proteins
MDTIYDLEVHLSRIEDYLKYPATDSTTESNTEIDLQDEREVTKQCLRICKDAKSYLIALQDQESSLLDEPTQDTVDSPRNQFEAQLSVNRGLSEARDKLAEIIGRLQERLDTMDQNTGPERDFEKSRLEEEINMQKQCLAVCKRVSNQVADRKIHTFGEIIAEGDSDQMVITTLADLFDVKKAWSKTNSSQMIGSTTEEALIKISADRYKSRFGAVTPQVRVATETRRSNPLPPNDARKDAQLADAEKRQNKPSSNSVRKRTSEGD